MTTRNGVRTQRVTIEMLRPGDDPFVHLQYQKVEVDDATGDVLSATSRAGQINRLLTDVATQTIQATDPVTQEVLTVSAAGAAEIVRQFAVKWFDEELGTTYNATIKKALFP